MSNKQRNCRSRGKHLRFESLEDRRMLTTMTDIVFILDESSSGSQASTQEWVTRASHSV